MTSILKVWQFLLPFEQDLYDLFHDRMVEDEEFCKDIWAALANVSWHNVKTGDNYSCSFRHAGSLIAHIIDKGCYLDWYCCTRDGVVTEEIEEKLKTRGWEPEQLWL